MATEKEIWFPAKKFGYGWEIPVRWQGWVVLVVYLAAIFAGMKRFIGGGHPVYFAVFMLVLSLLLIAVCMWKGEPPRWRWGND